MDLHVTYCSGWGLSEADMSSATEEMQTVAYTRYVMERGLAGDLLDLHVALAPCIVGYAEIGQALGANPDTVLDGNPYRSWIEMYAGDEYGAVAGDAVKQLDQLSERPRRYRPLYGAGKHLFPGDTAGSSILGYGSVTSEVRPRQRRDSPRIPGLPTPVVSGPGHRTSTCR